MKEENKNISDLASSFEALSKVVQSNSVALAPQFANIAEVTKIIEEKTAPLKAVAEAMQGWQSSFAPHFERFDAIREVFSKKVLGEMAMMQENIVKKYDILESDYNDFIIRLAPLWNELGVIRPRDFTQFMNWFFDCLHFDEPFYSLEIVRNDFILYGEYERCLALDRFWTDEQERERLRNKQADVHINSVDTSTMIKPKEQGRPKTIIHDASYYLQNKDLLPFLIKNYSNIASREFNQLMCALDEMELLKSATNKEYKESFGKALNVNQSQTNFNDNFRKKKIEEIFNLIKKQIKAFLDRD